ncbi:MAG: tetratricopeptide repeat protein [Pirellulales bacterium]|nr:tetratricopeptide repeat protein [Pirellulales bacterium]
MTFRDRIRRSKIHGEAEGYLELGLPQHALTALGRLGEEADLDVHSLYLCGEALRSMDRHAEALRPLVQAALAAPQNVHVWFALGWCYKRTGRIDLAIDSLERALAAEPTEGLVHYNLACYWSLAGNKQRALEYLSRALHIDPDFRELIDDEPDFDPLRWDPDFLALRDGSETCS